MAIVSAGLVAVPVTSVAAPDRSTELPAAGWTADASPPTALPAGRSRAAAGDASRLPQSAAPRQTTAIARSTYVDACEDGAGAAYDIRRVGVSMADDGSTMTFSVRACPDEPSLRDLDDEAFAWVTTTTDARRVQREFVVQREGDGLTVRDGKGNGISGGQASVHTPVQGVTELTTTVPTGRVGLGGDCAPQSGVGCLQVALGSYDGGGDVRDAMPDLDPNISAPVWPSSCRADVDPAARGHVRASTATAEDARTVEARLRDAGYRASAHTGAPYVEITVGADAEVRDALGSWPEVRDVVTLGARRMAAVQPDDREYDKQWYLRRLRVPAAWNTRTGSSTGIAVVDNGVASDRPDLAGRVGRGWDGLTQSPLAAGTHSDLGGHGTAVAGLAAARGNNSRGIAGVDWRATIHPVRVFDHEGCFISEDAYLQALDWIADRAADGLVQVANFSLGGGFIPGEGSRVATIVANGAAVVAAMGNNGDRSGALASFPAALPDVVAVGATGPDDRLASYSNRGRHVDLVAPGGDQSGTPAGDLLTLADPTSVGPSYPYAPLAGTSFSSPLVAGMAALYRGEHPDATPADVTRALITTAHDLGTGLAGHDISHGFGLADAAAMLSHRPDQRLVRVAGANRYATAAATSRHAFTDPDLVDIVLLATGEGFPDALAGGPLAAREHAPLLLTESSRLHPAAADELRRLAPERVVLLGGEGALTSQVASQVQSLGISVDRAAGTDRYATAATIALGGSGRSWRGWSSSDVVYLATGENFPDALPAGSAAAAFGAPLLLTARTQLPAPTRDALQALRPGRVVVVGGESAVTSAVVHQVAQLGIRVDRAAGDTRYETAVAALCPVDPLCVRDTRIAVVSTGEGFADALGGTAAAAALRAPLLLVPQSGQLPTVVSDALSALRPEQAVVLGGTVPVPRSIASQVRARVVR